MASTDLLTNTILEGILDKKGERITLLNLEKVENAFCDRFVICQANSNTQVSAIAESIEKKVKEDLNERVHHREGLDNSIWVLLDFNEVLVHIFQSEYREHYKLEELWGDAQITEINESFNTTNNE